MRFFLALLLVLGGANCEILARSSVGSSSTRSSPSSSGARSRSPRACSPRALALHTVPSRRSCLQTPVQKYLKWAKEHPIKVAYGHVPLAKNWGDHEDRRLVSDCSSFVQHVIEEGCGQDVVNKLWDAAMAGMR